MVPHAGGRVTFHRIRAMGKLGVIDLYTAATPNGCNASVTLEVLGLDYNVKPLELSGSEQKQPCLFEVLDRRLASLVPNSIPMADIAVLTSAAFGWRMGLHVTARNVLLLLVVQASIGTLL